MMGEGQEHKGEYLIILSLSFVLAATQITNNLLLQNQLFLF